MNDPNEYQQQQQSPVVINPPNQQNQQKGAVSFEKMKCFFSGNIS